MSEITVEVEKTEAPSRERFRSWLGSVLLFLGIAVLSLLVADRAFGLPVSLPRSWYTDRGLWVAIGLISFGSGWYLLGDPEPAPDKTGANRETRHNGVRFEQIVLYTRPGCHLCDLARETLQKHGDSLPPPIEVDIDTDPSLRARFSTCVPVVEIDGKIRFRGRINEVLLRRLIEATPPKSPV
jgi:glutaredoxin